MSPELTQACAWLLAVLAVGLLTTSCREESAAPGPDSVAAQGPFENDADAIAAALAAFIRTHQAEIPVSLKSLDGPRYPHRNEFLSIGRWVVYPIEPDGCKAVCPITLDQVAVVFFKKKEAKYEVVRFDVEEAQTQVDPAEAFPPIE